MVRHIPETGTQRLLLEKGDIDVARKLTPEDLDGGRAEPGHQDREGAQGQHLVHRPEPEEPDTCPSPRCVEALKWLIDYDGSPTNIMKGKAIVHETFLPKGFLGALDDKPYHFDPAKGKELLAKAGLPNGFKVTMDTRNNSPTKRSRPGDPVNVGARPASRSRSSRATASRR